MWALTLTQPWASLVVLGEKRYETRSWRPPAARIGERIAIHAAAGWAAIDRRIPARGALGLWRWVR